MNHVTVSALFDLTAIVTFPYPSFRTIVPMYPLSKMGQKAAANGSLSAFSVALTIRALIKDTPHDE